MPSELFILSTIDDFLRMLYANANRKRLSCHLHAIRIELAKRITRAVANRQNRLFSQNFFTCRQNQALQLTIRNLEVFNLRLKPHLATQRDDFLSDIFHDITQQIRSNMRMRLVENFLRRTSIDELRQHLATTQIFDTTGQLPIRKRPSATLAKLHVRLRIQLSFGPKCVYGFNTVIDGFAAFQNEWLVAHLRKEECSIHASRSKTDNDWSV